MIVLFRLVLSFAALAHGSLTLASFLPVAPQEAASSPKINAEISELQANALKGDVAAQVKLGKAYMYGDGLSKNDELAAKWFRKAADQGDASAEDQLGNMYRSGIGVARDKEEAVRWYMKASRHGSATGMFNLGTCFYNGDGVGSNEYTAYLWFLLAQDAGEPAVEDAVKRSGSTMSNSDTAEEFVRISNMYYKGEELPKDDAQSLRWLRRAAEINSRAKVLLAVRLLSAPQPEHHYSEVLDLCKAAARDDATGQRCVGHMYRHGWGVNRDPAEAIKWYKMAVSGNNVLAAFELGEMCASGEGTKVDRPEAFMMFLEAAQHGVKGAREKALALYQQMDKADIKKTNGKLTERRLDPKKVVTSLQKVPTS